MSDIATWGVQTLGTKVLIVGIAADHLGRSAVARPGQIQVGPGPGGQYP